MSGRTTIGSIAAAAPAALLRPGPKGLMLVGAVLFLLLLGSWYQLLRGASAGGGRDASPWEALSGSLGLRQPESSPQPLGELARDSAPQAVRQRVAAGAPIPVSSPAPPSPPQPATATPPPPQAWLEKRFGQQETLLQSLSGQQQQLLGQMEELQRLLGQLGEAGERLLQEQQNSRLRLAALESALPQLAAAQAERAEPREEAAAAPGFRTLAVLYLEGEPYVQVQGETGRRSLRVGEEWQGWQLVRVSEQGRRVLYRHRNNNIFEYLQ